MSRKSDFAYTSAGHGGNHRPSCSGLDSATTGPAMTAGQTTVCAEQTMLGHRNSGTSTLVVTFAEPIDRGGVGVTMHEERYGLDPTRFIGSVAASCRTLDLPLMKLLDIIDHAKRLTADAPLVVIGGLAQILWARKTHTDDLGLALAATNLTEAYRRVREGEAEVGWTTPRPPDQAHESDDLFQVAHLLFRGAVVDLIAFHNEDFTKEIIRTATPVAELGGARFVRPELLLIMHLLRPGPEAALAATELVLARNERGGLDLPYVRKWAQVMGREERLENVLRQAEAFQLM